MLLMAAIVDVHSVPAAAVKDEELAIIVAEEELTAALLELMEELETAVLLELFAELLLFVEDELAATELLLLAEEELVVTELELFAELELATVLEDDETVAAARFGMLPEARRAVKMRMASLKSFSLALFKRVE
jgi:hypothetical protein